MYFNTKLKLNSLNMLLGLRGLEARGEVQRYIDSEVLRLSDPYIPFDTGKLKESGTRSTTIGSGKVVWRTPYGKKQYYENKGEGLRGKMWVERMKADKLNEILDGAADIARGRSE